MKRTLLIWILLCSPSLYAQRVLIGFDLIPHPLLLDNYEVRKNTLTRSDLSNLDFRFGYLYGDSIKSVIQLSYSLGGYTQKNKTFPVAFDYHLFKLGYGIWQPVKYNQDIFLASVCLLLAPTNYTWTVSQTDHFGYTLSETYKKTRINTGLELGISYLIHFAGSTYLKAGITIVFTPQVTGPFNDSPFVGYNPGPYLTPGGGWIPYMNGLLNLGLLCSIKQ